MKYLSQLLPPFIRKKRNVIKGSDRVKLVPEDAKNIGDADKEYNTVDDITTYTNQQLTASNGIYNELP